MASLSALWFGLGFGSCGGARGGEVVEQKRTGGGVQLVLGFPPLGRETIAKARSVNPSGAQRTCLARDDGVWLVSRVFMG